jgi:cytochrome c oxidase cbb3-type subunit I/II
MATFEGPMLSLKNVNAIAHYRLDYCSRSRRCSLERFMAFGMIYWLVPRMTKGTFIL